MGRLRAGDERQVLAAARRLYRERSYAGTSIRDLEQATAVHPGSLYRAFGDEQGPFLAALRSYNREVVHPRVDVHLGSTDDPLEGIRAFFTSTIDTSVDGMPGCLVTNSAVESLTLAPVLPVEVGEGLEIIEEGLGEAVGRLGRLRADAAHATDDVVYRYPLTEVAGVDGLSAYMFQFPDRLPGHRFELRSMAAHDGRSLAQRHQVGPDGSLVQSGASAVCHGPDGRLDEITGFFLGAL